MTGPQHALPLAPLPAAPRPASASASPARPSPPSPAPADVPGFEFESRRQSRQRQNRDTTRNHGNHGNHAAAPPRRFRFTPTVSSGPPQPLPEDRPGFEFDGAFPAARRHRSSAPPALDGPGTAARPTTPRAQAPRSLRETEPPDQIGQIGQPNVPARTEWTKLVRSFLPQPEKRNLTKEFRANLNFRGWALRVGVPIVTMIAVGVAVVVVVGAHNGNAGPAPSPATLGFPPATLAGGDFTAAATTRGINQSLGRVASAGNEVVAVGSQSGGRIPRAQFFFSHNGGGSWSLATESAAAGGAPPPGHAARLVAGGQGNWVAIGPDSIWVSGNGQAWSLVSTKGLPDQVSVLRRTSTGFIAAGTNVLFVSANGTSWQRVAGPATALDIKYVAAAGNSVLIAGDVQADRTIAGHPAAGTAGQAWLSRDGGRSWTPVAVPAGHGAQAQFAGVAAAGAGYVAVRPAVEAGLPAANVWRSADGMTWTFAATLSSPTGFVPGVVNGGAAGAVVTGESAGELTAFVSAVSTGAGGTGASGAQWQQTPQFGSAASESVSGVAVTEGGSTVVTAGPIGASRTAPVIKVLATGAGPRDVSLGAIPGAVVPQVAVNAVAAQGNAQVAVGSANGYAAAWLSTDGGSTWSRATGQTPAVLDRSGGHQLTSVVNGSAGWLAVGGVTSGAPQHPVVIGSADGRTWAAADTEPVLALRGLFTEQAAASAKGYVIVGYQQTASGRTIAAAWWSAGLTGWRRATDATPGALDGPGNRQMMAVSGTTGGFTGVGFFGEKPAAWTSPDGRQWRGIALPLPSGATRAVLLHVAASGQIVVAAGTEQTTSGGLLPFAARSADGGQTWTETPLPVPSGVAQVTALAAAGGTFTATGSFGASPGHQDVVVWTSSDGVTWKATTPGGQGLAGPGIQAITGLTVSGSTLTGVGFTASQSSEQPLFWQSPIR